MSPSWYIKNLASAYFAMAQYDDAIMFFKKVLDQNPGNYSAHIGLAAAHSVNGNDEEARQEVQEILKINPKFSLANFAEMDATKDQAEKKRFLDALRKAGLPE
jgi:tetratricopeptide (TPR) repeat protein